MSQKSADSPAVDAEARRGVVIVALFTVGLIIGAIVIALAITLPKLATKDSGYSTIGTATGEVYTVEEESGSRSYLEYAYEVDGERYTVVGEASYRDADTIERKSQGGATVLVTYDPDDPGTAMADDAMPGCSKALHCEELHY